MNGAVVYIITTLVAEVKANYILFSSDVPKNVLSFFYVLLIYFKMEVLN